MRAWFDRLNSLRSQSVFVQQKLRNCLVKYNNAFPGALIGLTLIS